MCTSAYYRGAMGILLVYDVTDKATFESILCVRLGSFLDVSVLSCAFYIGFFEWKFLDIRNWIKNIEQHASDSVNKMLIGNKADMDPSKRVWSESTHPALFFALLGISRHGFCFSFLGLKMNFGFCLIIYKNTSVRACFFSSGVTC